MPRVLGTGRRLTLQTVQRFFALLSLSLLLLQSANGIVNAAFDQSAYRFAINLDAANPSALTSNPSALDDTIKDSVIDTANSAFYIVGHTTTNWVIEKRSELHGSGITAFGTGGQIIEDVASSLDEGANSIAVDPNAGHIYIAGYDRAPGATNSQWRIEKRKANSGNLCTAAECGTAFGTNGVVSSNPTIGDDFPLSIVLDTAGGYVYTSGYDSTSGNQWRIEKRLMTDGSLVAAFGTSGVFTLNPSNQDDKIRMIDIDPTGQYLYIAGSDEGNGNTAWRVDKRRASDAALCTAVNCGTAFDTDGIYNSNPSARGDNINSLQVDDAGGAIYVGGYDAGPGNNNEQWRVEKLDLNTGALITSFATSGVLTTNPSAGTDAIVDLDLDGAGGFFYIIGTDANGANQRWRIEKRNRTDGSLVTTFGASGILTSDPSGNNDPASKIMIDIDRTFLWALGGDRTNGATNMRWRIEQYQLDDGDYWLAATNTRATASTGISFRLRMLIHTDTTVITNGATFKLRYAQKVGTCDTAQIGESWSDIDTSSGEVRYFDNPTLADASSAVAITGDPTHSGHTNVLQSIEEANNFTNPNSILLGQDGVWDFVLQDQLAFGAYCFKAVDSAGADLGTYTVIPEITFCKDTPKTEGLLRHGTYFCEGLKKPFFWAND
jgi:hypothetical protein